jgi:hypothetical protein
MIGTTTTRSAGLGVVLATAAALGLSACGSSSPSTSSTGSGAGSSPSASPFNTASATTAVTTVWTNFFSKNTPIAQKEALLQNGGAMSSTVQAFASNPMVGQTTAAVQSVTFPSPTKADVTYSISLNGHVVENSMSGVAVYQNGKWLVSDVTLCGLLQLAQSAGGSSAPIPGCSS